MNEQNELAMTFYSVLPNGIITIGFSDSLALQYTDETSLDQDCLAYDGEVVEHLRKYIVCYCASVNEQSLLGKKLVFNLLEPDGNIVKII
jgi:hypothetical protein